MAAAHHVMIVKSATTTPTRSAVWALPVIGGGSTRWKLGGAASLSVLQSVGSLSGIRR